MSGLLDTRHNLLTVLLVAAIGVLGLGLLAQFAMMGRPDVDAIAPSGSTEVSEAEVDVPETGLARIDDYGSITARPVFFSDRRLPVIEMPDEEALAEQEEFIDEEEPINELKAAVAGIIITPELRLAMVRDETSNETLVLREGMSLEGEQAAWRLDSIEQRQVNFVSVDGRESLLELAVNTSSLAAGSSGRQPTNYREPEEGEEGDRRVPTPPDSSQVSDARARAEEVRRRVAERRAELRAEAERRAQLQQQNERDN
ncbi:hypothetical protein [Wenzhouxiangella marina]|uniref:Uncharacterized protein n=1 Tax=Wenzhouxiangella marina TaxID=1579979 RepID=A0A0K0XT57_9GAMM|nr:hypothetical protein [Wenzhouxiangella marina]AKS40873.1 hypothetical protein WM2015_491 [Wenzhouxiangella marina]MBB6087747.1 hypothetical protein [Wenzhouxiangella marina]